MYEVIQGGIFTEVFPRQFGKQDQAVTPGGPQDCFSFETGRILLNGGKITALEIIQAPVLKITEPVFLTVCGAPSPCFINDQKLEHAAVYRAEEGDTVSFEKPKYGFRTYLSLKKAGKRDLSKRKRGTYKSISSWSHYAGKIRVIKGPEFELLESPLEFLRNPWRVTDQMDQMGMRIDRPEIKLRLKDEISMISEAVADGTVQLTPSGPIILMRHRQTTGGYPRIFNVISADIDMLAQYPPKSLLRFTQVTLFESINALKKQKNDLDQMKQMLKRLK